MSDFSASMTRITKPAFTVIGKEGSTLEGPDFIPRLWEDANGHFGEGADLAEHPFPAVIAWLEEQGLPPAGAVHDFSDPHTGENRMYYPIRRL